MKRAREIEERDPLGNLPPSLRERAARVNSRAEDYAASLGYLPGEDGVDDRLFVQGAIDACSDSSAVRTEDVLDAMEETAPEVLEQRLRTLDALRAGNIPWIPREDLASTAARFAAHLRHHRDELLKRGSVSTDFPKSEWLWRIMGPLYPNRVLRSLDWSPLPAPAADPREIAREQRRTLFDVKVRLLRGPLAKEGVSSGSLLSKATGMVDRALGTRSSSATRTSLLWLDTQVLDHLHREWKTVELFGSVLGIGGISEVLSVVGHWESERRTGLISTIRQEFKTLGLVEPMKSYFEHRGRQGEAFGRILDRLGTAVADEHWRALRAHAQKWTAARAPSRAPRAWPRWTAPERVERIFVYGTGRAAPVDADKGEVDVLLVGQRSSLDTRLRRTQLNALSELARRGSVAVGSSGVGNLTRLRALCALLNEWNVSVERKKVGGRGAAAIRRNSLFVFHVQEPFSRDAEARRVLHETIGDSIKRRG